MSGFSQWIEREAKKKNAAVLVKRLSHEISIFAPRPFISLRLFARLEKNMLLLYLLYPGLRYKEVTSMHSKRNQKGSHGLILPPHVIPDYQVIVFSSLAVELK